MQLSYTRESRMHLHAKEEIADMIRNGPGYLLLTTEVVDHFETVKIDVSDLDLVIECAYPTADHVHDVNDYCAEHGKYPEMIFDIGLVKEGRVLVAVEVMKSNWLDVTKQRKIHNSQVTVIGVTARTGDWRVDDVRLDSRALIVPRNALRRPEALRVGF